MAKLLDAMKSRKQQQQQQRDAEAVVVVGTQQSTSRQMMIIRRGLTLLPLMVAAIVFPSWCIRRGWDGKLNLNTISRKAAGMVVVDKDAEATILALKARIQKLETIISESVPTSNLTLSSLRVTTTNNTTTTPTTTTEKKRSQESHVTSLNRYPQEYKFIQEIWKKKKSQNNNNKKNTTTRILSYGSSTGREAVTLALEYFPTEATIYGVDIDDATIHEAKQFGNRIVQNESEGASDGGPTAGTTPTRLEFFNGLHTPLKTYGPYDIIFANSVLCKFPIPGYPKCDKTALNNNCPNGTLFSTSIYPYQTEFVEQISRLDNALKVGGFLAIVNSAYDIMSIPDVTNLQNYIQIKQCGGQFVPQYNTANQTLEVRNTRGCIYQKIR